MFTVRTSFCERKNKLINSKNVADDNMQACNLSKKVGFGTLHGGKTIWFAVTICNDNLQFGWGGSEKNHIKVFLFRI